MHVQHYPYGQLILENFGVHPFNPEQQERLYQEAVRLLKKQTVPRSIFYSLATFLRSALIEIPFYLTIVKLLTKAMRKRDTSLMVIIRENLSPQFEQTFEKMPSFDEDSNEKGTC